MIVYSKNNCKWCRKAINLLLSYQITFKLVNLENYTIEEKINLIKKYKINTVPIITETNGKLIGGFKELEERLMNSVKQKQNKRDNL